MKCVDCQDVLTEYALDSLGQRESEQVAEHLGGCMDCRQYLDVVRAEWSALADTLQPAPPPAHGKAELLARIRTESARSNIRRQYVFTPEPEPVIIARDGQSRQNAWRWQSMLPYIAATLCGIGLGFWSARNATFDSSLVDRYNAQLMQAERTFGAPQMRYAALHLSNNRPEVRGYLIWDSVAAQMHVYAFDLGAPPSGFTYRLWFVSDDQMWTAAGDLLVGADGVCSTVIEVPTLTKPASRVVVTTEPINGSNADEKKHGPIGLTGEFL